MFYPNTPQLCWRNFQHPGNLLHILWSCNPIREFWNKVASLITEISGITTTLKPALALLSISAEKYHPSVRTILMHILFAACISITKEWKSARVPSLETLMAKVNSQSHFEKLIACNKNNASVYHKKWDKWRTSFQASSHI